MSPLVLCWIDRSVETPAVYEHAAALARALGASLSLLYVLEAPVTIDHPDYTETLRRLADYQRNAKDSGIRTVRTAVRVGEVATQVVAAALKYQAHTIVWGYERTNSLHTSRNSTLDLLLRHTACSLYSIPL
jgi:nucleotide-binding universal stress UspA family protein